MFVTFVTHSQVCAVDTRVCRPVGTLPSPSTCSWRLAVSRCRWDGGHNVPKGTRDPIVSEECGLTQRSHCSICHATRLDHFPQFPPLCVLGCMYYDFISLHTMALCKLGNKNLKLRQPTDCLFLCLLCFLQERWLGASFCIHVGNAVGKLNTAAVDSAKRDTGLHNLCFWFLIFSAAFNVPQVLHNESALWAQLMWNRVAGPYDLHTQPFPWGIVEKIKCSCLGITKLEVQCRKTTSAMPASSKRWKDYAGICFAQQFILRILYCLIHCSTALRICFAWQWTGFMVSQSSVTCTETGI